MPDFLLTCAHFAFLLIRNKLLLLDRCIRLLCGFDAITATLQRHFVGLWLLIVSSFLSLVVIALGHVLPVQPLLDELGLLGDHALDLFFSADASGCRG